MKKTMVVCIAALMLSLGTAAAGARGACSAQPQLAQLCAFVDDIGSGGGGTNSVSATCKAVAGVTPGDPADTGTTWVIVAQASSSTSKTGVVPLSTGVTCIAYDADTGEELGRAQAGVPGPTAVAAGTVTVPPGHSVRFAGSANATFSDGSCANTEPGAC